jgi:hypothetical protein
VDDAEVGAVVAAAEGDVEGAALVGVGLAGLAALIEIY